MRQRPPGDIMDVVADLSEKSASWPGEEEEVVTVAGEMNKALVRRFFEAHAKGDLDTLRELLAPNFVDHMPLPGREDPDRESYIHPSTPENSLRLENRPLPHDDQASPRRHTQSTRRSRGG